MQFGNYLEIPFYQELDKVNIFRVISSKKEGGFIEIVQPVNGGSILNQNFCCVFISTPTIIVT